MTTRSRRAPTFRLIDARPVTLSAYRSQFAPPAGIAAYLDHAATGHLCAAARDAAGAFLDRRAGRDPDRSPNDYPSDLLVAERVRARVGALIGRDARGVEITPGTSHAVNVVARGLDWQPGDRVAVPACEFPANLWPWRALAPEGVEVDLIAHRDGLVTPDDVAAAMTPRTRVVAVSWVQFLSGVRCDVAGIADVAHAHGAFLVVDAIQGLGALRLDATHADAVATGTQKWLGAMQGMGLVYVADALLARLRPLVGWLNGPVDWDDFEASATAPITLHDDATRFRAGTLPNVQVHAADATLGVIEAAGMDAIEAATLANARTLADGLARLGLRRYGSDDPAHASGIVTVEADDPEGLHAHLTARGIALSLRSRKLRFAPHAHTPPEALEAALDAVASFGRSQIAVP